MDDILTQGSSEDAVCEALTQLTMHLQHRDWAAAPHKIQGPITTVKLLSIF